MNTGSRPVGYISSEIYRRSSENPEYTVRHRRGRSLCDSVDPGEEQLIEEVMVLHI